METTSPPADWLCTNRRAVRISPTASRRIDVFGNALIRLGRRRRIARQLWVRYRIGLAQLPPRPADVRLEPMNGEFVESLKNGKEPMANQIRSAVRFWEGGLRNAYVWFEDGEPLGMQWLLRPGELATFPNLGPWAGMFPPIPENCGFLENVYSFAGPARPRPGAATKLAIAVAHEARRLGYSELRTHVPQNNLHAHRWARRIGLSPYGIIDRYTVKLPRLPVAYICHHQSCEVRRLQPLHRL